MMALMKFQNFKSKIQVFKWKRFGYFLINDNTLRCACVYLTTYILKNVHYIIKEYLNKL